MKKIAVIISTCLLSFSLFAGGLNSRFIEVKAGADLTLENNTFAMSDFLVEHIVIDLTKIANIVPESGFNASTEIKPFAALNFNFPHFHFGVSVGADAYGSVNINQSLFDFLGKGYNKGQELTIKPDVYFESFLTVEPSIGVYTKKLKIDVIPGFFVPLAVADTSKMKVVLQNTTDAKFKARTEGAGTIYALFDVEKLINGDYSQVTSLSVDEAVSYFINHLGFDFGTSVEFPLNRSFSIIGKVRIPIKPGTLNYSAEASFPFEEEFSLSELLDNMGKENETSANNGAQGNIMDNLQFTYRRNSEFAAHRPLKAMAYAKFSPFGEFLVLTGGAGVGVRRPFVNPVSYPEYYVSVDSTIFGGLLSAGVSTEYQDQVFINKVKASIGLRLVQIDLGIAVSSSSFIKSFDVNGASAYIMFAAGL